MDRKEWDRLKAEGKLVELFPKDLRPFFTEDFTYHALFNTETDRRRNGEKARWLRQRYIEVIEASGQRIAK